eukprot:g32462.t1
MAPPETFEDLLVRPAPDLSTRMELMLLDAQSLDVVSVFDGHYAFTTKAGPFLIFTEEWAQSDFLASGGEERLTGVMTSPLSERQETRPRLKQIRLWAQCELLSFRWEPPRAIRGSPRLRLAPAPWAAGAAAVRPHGACERSELEWPRPLGLSVG